MLTKCFKPKNHPRIGSRQCSDFYLVCQKARRETNHFMGMASTLILGDATNEESFLYLSRQKLLYSRITQTADYSLWRRLYCTYSGYAADFLRPETGKNILILSKYNLKKGKPAGVKSLIGLFCISFSLSNFVAKNVHLFDKINEDL